MLVSAALIPPIPAMVPGAAGRADVLGPLRELAVDAVEAILEANPERVVVVVDSDTAVSGPLRATLTAAGVPERVWNGASVGAEDPVRGDVAVIEDVAVAVAAWALHQAGWQGQVEVVGVRADGDRLEPALDGDVRVAALMMGAGSARRGPDAPVAEDPGAEEADESLQTWLRSGEPGGLTLDAAEIAHHAMSAVPVFNALLTAARSTGVRLELTDLDAQAPFGATYVVGVWSARGLET